MKPRWRHGRLAAAAEAAVDANDIKALDRPEHRAFLDSWLRAEARARLAFDAALKTGDNRWLRARFVVVDARADRPAPPAARCLAAHIDDNGVRGVPELIDRYAAATGATPAETEPLRKAVADVLAQTEKHRIGGCAE